MFIIKYEHFYTDAKKKRVAIFKWFILRNYIIKKIQQNVFGENLILEFTTFILDILYCGSLKHFY
jgi:hypothetical protein